ncbi:MAG: hypothetical protein COC04_04125 [Gammaproteobacteria bacterium]|nr:MAG: hypothetical protein COC04_04125 [Gammaproteobacteria bacterium]
MDLVSHVLIGACVAQIPSHSTNNSAHSNLSFYQRALIGGIAAIFPDIDYLLFLWNPLEFLAYWHRAETHSLLLAPLWALLLTKLWMLSNRLKQVQQLVFWICILGVLSHSMLDSLTTYGTQWFSPLSDYRISWNLLFIVDGYFTIVVVITFLCMYFWPHKKIALFILLLPISYLFLVYQIKLIAYQEIRSSLVDKTSTISILPQPFSPFYWHVIRENKEHIAHAYLRLADDPLVPLISNLVGKKRYQDHFQRTSTLLWVDYALTPKQIDIRDDANRVWNHESFRAFRDFAVYPIYYQHNKVAGQTCVWYSDLRYHSPAFLPSFRYGMCSEDGQNWTVHRMKYLTHKPVRIYQ